MKKILLIERKNIAIKNLKLLSDNKVVVNDNVLIDKHNILLYDFEAIYNSLSIEIYRVPEHLNLKKRFYILNYIIPEVFVDTQEFKKNIDWIELNQEDSEGSLFRELHNVELKYFAKKALGVNFSFF